MKYFLMRLKYFFKQILRCIYLASRICHKNSEFNKILKYPKNL